MTKKQILDRFAVRLMILFFFTTAVVCAGALIIVIIHHPLVLGVIVFGALIVWAAHRIIENDLTIKDWK